MNEHLMNLLIVSVAFIIAFSLTLGFVFPLQRILLANVPITISLLFLPHGVRILAFYFYGWKAIFYILPASLLMTYITASTGVPLELELSVVSTVACYVGYKLGTLIMSDDESNFGKHKWKFFLFVGSVSSVVNGAAHSVYKEASNPLTMTLGYIIGDMAGLMLAFYMLIIAFRIARSIPRH
jgi:hypothetical protein